MTRRKVEIENRRHTAQNPGGNGVETEHIQLVDVGEVQVHFDVPSGEGHKGTPASDTGTQASTPDTAGPQEAEQLRAQVAEYLDLAQRKEAELRNFVKRVQQDLDDARRFAIESLLEDLFPVLDGLAQAARTYKDTPAGENPLLDGMRGTVRALEAALLKHGIQRIDETGVPYDAEIHQALSVDGEGAEERVAEVYVQGYRLGDKVLKPAMVRVEKV